MVVAMDADLMAPVAGKAHHAFVPAAHVRARHQHPVQERAEAVGGKHAGAADLAQEPGTEDALDRAAGVVRAEREEERGFDVELIKKIKEIRYADARAPVGVDVDLDGEKGLFIPHFGYPPHPGPLPQGARVFFASSPLRGED